MTQRPANPRFLRSAQAADIFQVSPKTVARWAKEGKLPFVRTLGGHRRYDEMVIWELIAQNTSRPTDRPTDERSDIEERRESADYDDWDWAEQAQ